MIIATCPVGVATPLTAADFVARFAPRVTLATITPPAGAVDGARELDLADGFVRVDADGVISDSAALETLTAAREFAESDLEQAQPAFSASWALVEPIRVTVVPPSSIFGLSGSRGCVQEGSGPVSVTVIASQLGRTLVVPTHPLAAIAIHPHGGTGCP